MEANAEAVKKVKALKDEYKHKMSSNLTEELRLKEEYKAKLDEIKDGEDTPSVIIKISDKAVYKDQIDILDEMQICNIGKYVIDNFKPEDKAKIDAKFGGK